MPISLFRRKSASVERRSELASPRVGQARRVRARDARGSGFRLSRPDLRAGSRHLRGHPLRSRANGGVERAHHDAAAGFRRLGHHRGSRPHSGRRGPECAPRRYPDRARRQGHARRAGAGAGCGRAGAGKDPAVARGRAARRGAGTRAGAGQCRPQPPAICPRAGPPDEGIRVAVRARRREAQPRRRRKPVARSPVAGRNERPLRQRLHGRAKCAPAGAREPRHGAGPARSDRHSRAGRRHVDRAQRRAGQRGATRKGIDGSGARGRNAGDRGDRREEPVAAEARPEGDRIRRCLSEGALHRRGRLHQPRHRPAARIRRNQASGREAARLSAPGHDGLRRHRGWRAVPGRSWSHPKP